MQHYVMPQWNINGEDEFTAGNSDSNCIINDMPGNTINFRDKWRLTWAGADWTGTAVHAEGP